MNKEIIENKEKNEKIDSVDILIILLGIGLMIMCIFAGTALSRNFDKTEESCVSFYKENHYITESCKKYSKKLEVLDLNEK